jgi:P-type Cu+ transporter
MLNRKPQETPRIVSIVVFGDRNETALLAMAASLGLVVNDPLGAAILETAPDSGTELPHVEHVQSMSEKGVAGSVDGHVVVFGNSSFLADLGLSIGNLGDWAGRLAQQGQRVMFLAVDGQPAGFLKLSIDSDPRRKRR